MLSREKIAYSIFFIVILILVSTIAFLYSKSQASLQTDQIRMQSMRADMISREIGDMIGRFHRLYIQIQDYDWKLANGYISNETKHGLYDATMAAYFHIITSDRALLEVEITKLADPQSYETYANISETMVYSLDQIEFAAYFRTENESSRLIGELHTVLGINTTYGNYSGWQGIYRSFYEMQYYWAQEAGGLGISPQPEPSTWLSWALANATQLYQDLANWHGNNPYQPYPPF